MGSLVNSTKHKKKKIILLLYDLFQKTEEEGILSTSFYEASINLMPKPDKDITRNYRPVS